MFIEIAHKYVNTTKNKSFIENINGSVLNQCIINLNYFYYKKIKDY